MLRRHALGLLRQAIGGNWRLGEPAMDLLLLPLANHVLLLVCTLALPVGFARLYASTALVVVMLHVLVAIRIGGGGLRDLLVLATAPFYILWKLTLVRLIQRSAFRDAAWIRTHRETGDSSRHD